MAGQRSHLPGFSDAQGPGNKKNRRASAWHWIMSCLKPSMHDTYAYWICINPTEYCNVMRCKHRSSICSANIPARSGMSQWSSDWQPHLNLFGFCGLHFFLLHLQLWLAHCTSCLSWLKSSGTGDIESALSAYSRPNSWGSSQFFFLAHYVYFCSCNPEQVIVASKQLQTIVCHSCI